MRLGSSSSHPSLAEKEKQRRERMKDLYSTLATLLRLQPYERIPLLKFLDQATTSLQHLSERVERLKGKKEELEKIVNDETRNVHKLQLVQVREFDLELEAILIIMVNNKRAVPSEVFRVIEEGGAQIMSSSFSTGGHYIYCNIHAKAFQARVGFDAELIETKLLELVYNP